MSIGSAVGAIVTGVFWGAVGCAAVLGVYGVVYEHLARRRRRKEAVARAKESIRRSARAQLERARNDIAAWEAREEVATVTAFAHMLEEIQQLPEVHR